MNNETRQLTPKQEMIMHQRYTMICGLLPIINDKRKLAAGIRRTAEEYEVCKPTVRKYLKLYLENEDMTALAPKDTATGREELTDFAKDIRWGLNKFYYTTAKRSLKDAYILMLKEKYYKNGELAEVFPTFWQFRYYYRTHNKKQNEIISRQGLSYYQKNERPLLGDGVQEYAPVVGTGMLDSTVCDIYLVNDAGEIVGRPILTACVDAYSGLCCGYSLGWEGGNYSLRNLMLNIVKNKREHCLPFGISISACDWNCSRIPAKLITDKGSEYASENFEQLAELGITIVNLPAYRPELKGSVEKFFDLVQGYFKPLLKGKGVIEPDFQERGAQDYRKQACLTLQQFEAVLLHCIIFYNTKRIIQNFPYTDEMLEAEVKPCASSIWNWGCQQDNQNLLSVGQEQLIMTLLPRTTGKFTRKGLIVNRLRYSNDNFNESYLSGKEVIVAFHPDTVNQVWLLDKGHYISFDLIESRFKDKSCQEVERMQIARKSLIKEQEESRLLADVELADNIMTIANTARNTISAGVKSTKGIRQTRQKERLHQHLDIVEEGVFNG